MSIDWEMSIDKQIEILQAYKDGRNVEILIRHEEWSLIKFENHAFDFRSRKYRIAPEPELVPWEASDVPMPICWVRIATGYPMQRLETVVMIDPYKGVGLQTQSYVTFPELFDHYEHSTDGKTWKPCGKFL